MTLGDGALWSGRPALRGWGVSFPAGLGRQSCGRRARPRCRGSWALWLRELRARGSLGPALRVGRSGIPFGPGEARSLCLRWGHCPVETGRRPRPVSGEDPAAAGLEPQRAAGAGCGAVSAPRVSDWDTSWLVGCTAEGSLSRTLLQGDPRGVHPPHTPPPLPRRWPSGWRSGGCCPSLPGRCLCRGSGRSLTPWRCVVPQHRTAEPLAPQQPAGTPSMCRMAATSRTGW